MIFFLTKKTLRSSFVEYLLLAGCLIIFFSIPAGNFSCLPDFLTILDISFTINHNQPALTTDNVEAGTKAEPEIIYTSVNYADQTNIQYFLKANELYQP